MEIMFNRVVPAFLAGTTHFSSQVWNNTFSIAPGAKVLVKAQSGKGKTTFLSYLFGSRKGYTGQISLAGKDIAQYSLMQWSDLRTSEVSMVFQDLRLFDNLTVRENLEMKIKLTGALTLDECIRNLDMLGMAGYIDRPCAQLSMGQQQRVAIVRSLAQPFKWLLMDEPFSHLDEANMAIAMRLIESYCEKNKAGFILSSLGPNHSSSFDNILEL
jgi:putative ABC transport system ATP-binding protein